jgi:hypothetical protein
MQIYYQVNTFPSLKCSLLDYTSKLKYMLAFAALLALIHSCLRCQLHLGRPFRGQLTRAIIIPG